MAHVVFIVHKLRPSQRLPHTMMYVRYNFHMALITYQRTQ